MRIDLWIYGLLTAAIFAAYGQTGRFEFINLDDLYSVRNPHVVHGFTRDGLIWAFESIAGANWFPLTWISHMLDRQLFGDQSGYHHLSNVGLHAISSVLLLYVLERMTGARWPSAFVAFVFALHPLHVESVAWVAERKDVLSALFWILTLWAYLRYTQRPGALRYLVTILMFSLGLMSKAMLVTLPFALVLLDVWPLGRFKAGIRDVILEKVPLIGLSAGASAVTFYAQRRAGALSSLEQIPLGGRVENALISPVAYLIQFIWPSNLAVFYPYMRYSGPIVAIAGAVLAAITILAVRARRHPYLAAGWFWYLGTLVPVIGLVQVGAQSRADRYTYIPLIGISMMVAFGAAEFIKRQKVSKTLAGIFAGLVCAAWFVITWNQAAYWHDSVTLFEHAIEVTPANDLAYSSLGEALRKQGRIDEGIADLEHAIAIRPTAGGAQNNLGEALLTEGRIEEALPHLAEAVRLQPQAAESRVNLATALNLTGRRTEAEAQYRLALDYDPDSAEAHGGLGVVLNENGREQEALNEMEQSVRLKPDDAAGHYNLGRVLSQLGRNPEAITQYSEATRLQPSSVDAHVSLGAALAAEHKPGEALVEFRTAERLNPNSVGAHFSAAMALADLGRYEEATREFQETLRLKPDFAAAKQSIEYYSNLQSKSHGPR
ncbi:MAG TPA: tetratricopeptide repeat protein [Bryobacteraceae bacterium]|nr:tetratricopeptide repeat protein [Bryobacteraceae bacterium]